MKTLNFALSIFILVLTSGFVGAAFGQKLAQATIVEECKNTGMYLDRNLLMVCQVGTPKVVPKPDTL